MKVLLTESHNPVINGTYIAINSIGLETATWSPGNMSIYDVIDVGKPDLFFCEVHHLTPNVVEAITTQDIKTVVFGVNNPIPTQVLTCVPKIPSKILSNLQTPYCIIEDGINLFNKQLLESINMPQSDVVYFCDRVDESILKRIQFLTNNIPIKIVGSIRLPFAEYVGRILPVERTALLYHTQVVVLDNTLYAFEAAVYGAFPITTFTNPLVPFAIDNEQLLIQIQEGIKSSPAKNDVLHNISELALKNTYFHRAHTIFTKLGYTELAQECLNQLSRVLASLSIH